MTTRTPDREALARLSDIASGGRPAEIYAAILVRVGEPRPSIQSDLRILLAKADQWLARSSGGGEVENPTKHPLAVQRVFDVLNDFMVLHGRVTLHQCQMVLRELDALLLIPAALPPPAPSGVGEETERLRKALETIKRELTIPAAEYVPAIPACWEIIDKALGQ